MVGFGVASSFITPVAIVAPVVALTIKKAVISFDELTSVVFPEGLGEEEVTALDPPQLITRTEINVTSIRE